MGRYAVLAALLAGACASQEASTGAGPQQPQSGWQRSYAVSDRTLAYTYAGGTIRPIPHSSLGVVREGWENR